ncbi:hypothetical protein LCGC14_1768990, partial [marine sediment metagenome]
MAESFTTTQQQFASYIRDPENTALPKGIEQRRMAIYRDLFFNNFDSTLSTAFPFIKQLHIYSQGDNPFRANFWSTKNKGRFEFQTSNNKFTLQNMK